eukprot:scaffold126207_cov27-Tisochrysis_lutea.AAC.3
MPHFQREHPYPCGNCRFGFGTDAVRSAARQYAAAFPFRPSGRLRSSIIERDCDTVTVTVHCAVSGFWSGDHGPG